MNIIPLILTDDDDLADFSETISGGKGLHLRQLLAMEQPVPSFYVIPSQSFAEFLHAHGIDEQLDGLCHSATRVDDAQFSQSLADVQRRIDKLPFPDHLAQAIREIHTRRFPHECGVAVRSSAVGEDGSDQSFAGIYESVLNVRGVDHVLEAVKLVWVSTFAQRVIAYRRALSMAPLTMGMAVIVQAMIDPRQAGVMLTCSPASGDPHVVVIDATYGVGEALLSEGFPADAFVVAKDSLDIIERTIADKREQLMLDERTRGLIHRPIDPADRLRSSLADEQLRQLTRAGMAIERSCGRPQEIEFAFDRAGKLFVLQTRPVTNVEEYGPAAGNHLIWDNSNIIESYSGVTSPMTFSFIRRAYAIVYHCFAEVMGIPPRVVKAHREEFENMLGLFRGRVFYNLKNWYRLVRMFPGFRYNSRFMESMMGLKEPLLFIDEMPPPGFWRRWFVELPALLRLLGRSFWNFYRIESIVARFQSRFREHYDAWSKIEFDALPPHELMRLYAKMEEALLWNWKAPIINDFFVMVNYGLLKKLCVTWCHDASGTLQNGLISGEGDIESAEPAELLLQLADFARSDAELMRLLLNEPAEHLPALIADDERFAEFQQRINEYLERFGMRCVGELKLEEESFCDRPDKLFRLLRHYLAESDRTQLDVAAVRQRQRDVRAAAEKRAFEAIAQTGGWLPRRWIFRKILTNARRGVRNRENMRFARTRIYGILRRMLRSIGHHLARERVLEEMSDIFYLTIDEVWDFIKGTAVTTDLRALVRLRREEYDRYRSETVPPPDDRFETFGLAYHRNRFQRRRPATTAPHEETTAASGTLRGIGCCPGIISGTVQIVLSPDQVDSIRGEILVAEKTDPGWVGLYPAFSGILIERGSALSHSSIVAREMGIPTIVGIGQLTARLHDGMRITMDGAAGTVEILDDTTQRAGELPP
ncbi:MAG: PEP/pyruvate-binding domain-containing protein [Planctomycetaceae bacterium]